MGKTDTNETRGTVEHMLWLFDLAHDNLSEDMILKGFVKFYALNNLTMGNVMDDLHFKMHYSVDVAMERLTAVLRKTAEGM